MSSLIAHGFCDGGGGRMVFGIVIPHGLVLLDVVMFGTAVLVFWDCGWSSVAISVLCSTFPRLAVHVVGG